MDHFIELFPSFLLTFGVLRIESLEVSEISIRISSSQKYRELELGVGAYEMGLDIELRN